MDEKTKSDPTSSKDATQTQKDDDEDESDELADDEKELDASEFQGVQAMDLLMVAMSASEARSMLTMFGSLGAVMQASREELKRVPGIGEKKLDKFWEAFHSRILS